jgi:hypothetical protein
MLFKAERLRSKLLSAQQQSSATRRGIISFGMIFSIPHKNTSTCFKRQSKRFSS